MLSVTRISALSALSLALLAAPTGAQDSETRRPVAGRSASEPLPVETLLSLSSSVGGETPRWAPEGDRILLGGSNLRLIRAEGGAISELPVSTGGSGHFLASAEPQWSPDGEWISYISDRSGTPEIWLWSVALGEAFRITGNGGRLIKGYSWSPDGAPDRVLRQSSRAARRVDGGGPVRGGSPADRRTRTGGLSRVEPRFRVCPVRQARRRMDGP